MGHKLRTTILGLTILLIIVACATVQQEEPAPKPVNKINKPVVLQDRLKVLATQAASRYNVDYRLFHTLVKYESNWNPRALSSKGARGLAQIMPNTGKSECGLEPELLFDPELNLHCGAFYFSKLLRRFNDVELALAAYNSGESRVARLGRVPSIRETQRYVRFILRRWRGG